MVGVGRSLIDAPDGSCRFSRLDRLMGPGLTVNDADRIAWSKDTFKGNDRGGGEEIDGRELEIAAEVRRFWGCPRLD